MTNLHVIFNGPSRLLKVFKSDGTLVVTFPCHDVGVMDGSPGDPYGHYCKCPPGFNYVLGKPVALHAPAYGDHFTPINDDPAGDMQLHGRSDVGIHGGGSDLPDPYADQQGWEDTFGCLRLQNIDNDSFSQLVTDCQTNGGAVRLDVYWA